MTPYYDDGQITLYLGECGFTMLAAIDPVDCIVTDPPYGDTSLTWDRAVDGWQELSLTPQLWCFGSLRFHLATHGSMEDAGWKYGQEVIWEKQNGSGFAADRFKRVHEIAVHWYRGDWNTLHVDTPVTQLYGSAAKVNVTVRATSRVPHTGAIAPRNYESDGERLTRSVIQARSEHGRAVHPTQKPLGILRPLIQYSVPKGGLVLDPFAGSASTLLAARELGRRAEGCEINPDYCEAAIKRLAQDTLDVEAA